MGKIFKFEFFAADVDLIGAALSKLPLGEAINTFVRFQQQLAAQQAAPTPAQVAAERVAEPQPNGSGGEIVN